MFFLTNKSQVVINFMSNADKIILSQLAYNCSIKF